MIFRGIPMTILRKCQQRWTNRINVYAHGVCTWYESTLTLTHTLVGHEQPSTDAVQGREGASWGSLHDGWTEKVIGWDGNKNKTGDGQGVTRRLQQKPIFIPMTVVYKLVLRFIWSQDLYRWESNHHHFDKFSTPIAIYRRFFLMLNYITTYC